jgi:ribosome-associated heat shock protein Hsp15
MPSPNPESVRIDKWLWAARFYKTRSLATTAVNGGKIHLNGARIKPSRAVKQGDTLHIQRGPYASEITILDLAEKRGPAKVAQALYKESEESMQKRNDLAAQQRFERSSSGPEHRPDKRGRRQLRRLQRGGD